MSQFDENLEELMKQTQKIFVDTKHLSPTDIRMFNPLVLAYIGDSVYDTFVRTMLVSGGSIQVVKLHRRAIKYVQAKAQAQILDSIKEMLTEDELDIVRRGRNTKSNTVPKNADINDYRYATGFEAMIGYLYLMGEIQRLMDIFEVISKIDIE